MERTLRDCNKDEFMVLYQGGMYVPTYEAMFHALSRYATQLVATNEERLWLFIRNLNFEFHVLSFEMTSGGSNFNKVIAYVNKMEGCGEMVKQMLGQRGQRMQVTFKALTLRGMEGQHLQPSKQSTMPASTRNYSTIASHNFSE